MAGIAGDFRPSRLRTLQARLDFAAECAGAGRLVTAERLFKQALAEAEELAGDDSPLFGSVLIDLFDFYERHERHSEASEMWNRIRALLIKCFCRGGTG